MTIVWILIIVTLLLNVLCEIIEKIWRYEQEFE